MSGVITIYEKETGFITGMKQWLTEAEKKLIIENIPKNTHSYKLEAAPSFEHKWNGKDWEVIPAPIEYALPHIRIRRSILLNNCDWTQAIDSPLPEQLKKEWAIYRQALRDLPSNYTDKDEASVVVWPEEPK